MEFDIQVKLAVYNHFAETGGKPGPEDIAERVSSDSGSVVDAYQRLCAQRVLVLEPDGSSIRMAPPFSGVPTQHVVEAAGRKYFANCAWDALGVPAALQKPARDHLGHRRVSQTLVHQGFQFGIAPADRVTHDDDVRRGFEVRRVETLTHVEAQFGQDFRGRRVEVTVGAGHAAAAGVQQPGQSRHAGPTDSDQMDVLSFHLASPPPRGRVGRRRVRDYSR